MQNPLDQHWFRIISGIFLLVLGFGGIIAGLVGSETDPFRYLIGGIVLGAIGINNFRLAQQSRLSK
jgi:hypothetical protein